MKIFNKVSVIVFVLTFVFSFSNGIVGATSLMMCDYAAPPQGCRYVEGSNYNPTTGCGMVLSCPTSPSASLFGTQVKAIVVTLAEGSRGSNVTILQQFLISQNKGSATGSLVQVGASGYFGVRTRAALAEFQASAGISPALGNFGPITRAYISAHY